MRTQVGHLRTELKLLKYLLFFALLLLLIYLFVINIECFIIVYTPQLPLL